MVEVTNTARQVRKFILNSFVNTGHAPNVGDIMEALGLTRAAILETFREIGAIDTFWIEKGTENIRLLAPFAKLGRDRARCKPFPLSPPFRTGLATFMASGSALFDQS